MDFSVGRWKSASGGTNGPREGVLGERSRTAGFVEEGADDANVAESEMHRVRQGERRRLGGYTGRVY